MGWLRDEKVDISKYLPEFERGDPVLGQTLAIESKEHERQRLEIRDLLAQAFIDTATWGLGEWERILDLKPDAGDSYEQRRNRILLKLQARQVSTLDFMARLCARYTVDKAAEIEEHNEENRFRVYLHGGVSDLPGLREALETYKPAHLAYLLAYYLVFAEEMENEGEHLAERLLVTCAQCFGSDVYPWAGNIYGEGWRYGARHVYGDGAAYGAGLRYGAGHLRYGAGTHPDRLSELAVTLAPSDPYETHHRYGEASAYGAGNVYGTHAGPNDAGGAAVVQVVATYGGGLRYGSHQAYGDGACYGGGRRYGEGHHFYGRHVVRRERF